MTSIRPFQLARNTCEPISRDRVPRWLRAILEIPLEQKVLGANLVIVAIASLVLMSPLVGARFLSADSIVIVGALTMGAVVSYLLIWLALKPVKTLERTARKVSLGRIRERVPPSLIADPDLAHLASTLNEMLDKLVADKKRMATLAAEVVYAQERERAQIARDLHDSLGQTLAAASFQVTAAASKENLAEVRAQLSSARDLLRTSLEEVRSVSRSLHPRVADDLGLSRALQALADRARQRSLIDVSVDSEVKDSEIPRALAATFYRIADEVLRIIETRVDVSSALITLATRKGRLELEITDDGLVDNVREQVRADPVLSNMRRRLSLAGGELHIDSIPEGGLRIVARADFGSPAKTEDEAA